MLSESDLNLLEAYLDDALSASEVQSLDARLAEEPELASSLDSLRADRKTRAAALMTFTPSEQEAQRLADSVIQSVRHQQRTRRWMRGIRIGAGVAACLLAGFGVGWIGRGHGPTTAPIAGPVIQPHLQNVDDVHLVIHTPQPTAGQYQVAVLDDKGNVIAIQPFKKVEDARRFADSVAKLQLQGSQPVLATGSNSTEPRSPHIRHAEPGPAPKSTQPASTQPTKVP